ncbi:MAG: hypothetical protein ACO3DK_01405 [Bacteroidia bacterium]
MQDDHGIQTPADRFDQGVAGHEPSVMVEGIAAVSFEQLQVANEVNYEKKAKKKPC